MAQKPPQSPEKILAELQFIRDLLDEKYFEPPLQPHLINPEAIPLLSEVVELPAEPPIQALVTEAAETAPTALVAPSEEILRQEAEEILQRVIEEFRPQIEAELKRRLAHLLPQ